MDVPPGVRFSSAVFTVGGASVTAPCGSTRKPCSALQLTKCARLLAGHGWRVDIYPGGYDTTCAGYLSLCLELVASGGESEDSAAPCARYELALCDVTPPGGQGGGPHHLVVASPPDGPPSAVRRGCVCALCILAPERTPHSHSQNRRLVRVKRFAAWDSLVPGLVTHVPGSADDVAVVRATVEVHRSHASGGGGRSTPGGGQRVQVMPPSVLAPRGPGKLAMSASSITVPRHHMQAAGGNGAAPQQRTQHHGHQARAPAVPAAAAPQQGASTSSAAAAQNEDTNLTVSRLVARTLSPAAAADSLRNALAAGANPPDVATLRLLADAVQAAPASDGSAPGLALGAAAIVRCLAASSAWTPRHHRPGGGSDITTGTAAALLSSRLVSSLLSAMAASPRDAELQRDGALALGAFALCALADGPPGFQGHVTQGGDALSLFAAASLTRLGIGSTATTVGDALRPRGKLVPHDLQAPADALTDVKTLLAARRRVAAALLVSEQQQPGAAPPAGDKAAGAVTTGGPVSPPKAAAPPPPPPAAPTPVPPPPRVSAAMSVKHGGTPSGTPRVSAASLA